MISVIIVNWNGAHDTIACIESLRAAERAPMRIIVVNNASPDDSMDVFAHWADSGHGNWVKFGRYEEQEDRFIGFEADGTTPAPLSALYIVESGRNGGFGFGCNIGMRFAETLGTSGYWLLNNDCIVSSPAVSRVSAAVAENPGTVFGTIVRYFSPPNSIQVYGGGGFSRLTGKNVNAQVAPPRGSLDYIYGASMVFSDHARRLIGGFDEKIFMYYEEMDFCLRAKAAGLDFDVVDTEVFHKHGGSQGGVSVSAWTNVLSNKYYVLHKHFGWGFWTIVYFASLLARCALPIGGKRASIGARSALKVILTKGAWR